jgi:hypothetical protein
MLNFPPFFSKNDCKLPIATKSNLLFSADGIMEENIIHKTTTLSQVRYALASTSSGELVFFAGGCNATDKASDRVDIYNVTSGNWTTATLSIPRCGLAATSVGNLVLFGGGGNFIWLFQSC